MRARSLSLLAVLAVVVGACSIDAAELPATPTPGDSPAEIALATATATATETAARDHVLARLEDAVRRPRAGQLHHAIRDGDVEAAADDRRRHAAARADYRLEASEPPALHRHEQHGARPPAGLRSGEEPGPQV